MVILVVVFSLLGFTKIGVLGFKMDILYFRLRDPSRCFQAE